MASGGEKQTRTEGKGEGSSASGEAGSRQILKAYILAEGAFAERYYSPALLENPEDNALPPEIRAAYRMASALADGAASRENVFLLKQAMHIYPPFHRGGCWILEELR